MVLEHLEGAIAKLKETVLELVTLPLLIKKRIISLLGAPGVGKRHLASTVGINTCTERYTVLFQSEDEVEGCLPVSSVGSSTGKRLDALSRVHLLIIDEPLYLPMEPKRADLFFQLVSQTL